MSNLLQQREVLVLNKNWNAISVISLERAIIMLFTNYKDGTPKAKIIDVKKDFQQFSWSDWGKIAPNENEDCIKTCKSKFKIPEVIILSKYEKLPMQKSNFSRRSLFKRDDFQCQYCGNRPGTSELTIDHVIPRSRGGKTTWDNTVLACVGCNSRKSNKTPEEAKMKLRTNPKRPPLMIFKKNVRKYESWNSFISDIYWNVELENDN